MSHITIKQIAAEAGVSIGTVDRVLHNRGRVSKEKAELILNICRQCGYEQNVVGRAMAMQRKQQTVAVVINSKDRNSFAAKVYEGIEAAEEKIKDYNVTFLYRDVVQNTVEEQIAILNSLEEENLAGLIIKPIDTPMIRFRLSRFADKGTPIVLCTSDMESVKKLCYVGQNHYRDGRLMANTLSKLSGEALHILMIVGPLQTSARRARIDGFLSYMQEHQRNYEISGVCEVSYQQEEAYRMTLETLKKYPMANALYINSPDVAVCLKALKDYGEFRGLRFSFGHVEKVGPFIQNRELDFAIREVPFQHGYRAGEAMFRYLLNKEIPAMESCVFRGEVLFEENSSLI
ncbi:LacI family DNA-binding transcriptional regulator [Caproicibacter sp.]|uniref:LacI family DNA-binding transcriptional regulator n=1 Tax=Caproicibacter sp. TaxID=2814884 RepID=UPI003988E641